MSQIYEQAQSLQNLLISRATGGHAEEHDYQELRKALLGDIKLNRKIPGFIKTCRNLDHLWGFIKSKFDNYRERREFIWSEFSSLLDAAEANESSPSDEDVSSALRSFSTEGVHAIWSKSLERRQSDPEGAITSARTLLESACKHILDEVGVPYDENTDLPKLYKTTAKVLNLVPSQHQEEIFRQILGSCTALVEGLGSLRNRLGDAHGKGKAGVKPSPRHAELAVNLSGAVATFLIATHDFRAETAR